MGNMTNDETSVLHKLLLEHWSSLLTSQQNIVIRLILLEIVEKIFTF